MPQETHIVDRVFNNNGQQVTSMHDVDGHGTACAAIALGRNLGVASNANLVAIKFTDVPNERIDAIADAWRWAIADVRSKSERSGKVVFSVPYGTCTSEGVGIAANIFPRQVGISLVSSRRIGM